MIQNPYNSSVKATLLNRISLILGSIGLYVALLLTLEKALNIQLPCGNGGGCAKVANHPSGVFLDVPVAYYGLFGYILITLITVLRFSTDHSNQRSLTNISIFLTGVGALASLWLQFVSFTVIRAFCPYCFTSAVAMVSLFVVQLLLRKTLASSSVANEAVADGEYPRPDAAGIQSDKKWKLIAYAVPVLALAIAYGQSTMLARQLGGVSALSAEKMAGIELISKDSHIFGDPAAPVTILEYADLGCPTCQIVAPKLKEYVEKNQGKIRLVYRHFLIDQHELSPTAAAMSEIAADKGRFWEYTGALMAGMNGKEIKEVQPIMDAATAAGLDTKEMVERLKNVNDPVYARITADRKVADAIGVNGTPTFVVMVPGETPKIMQAKGLYNLMESDFLSKLPSSTFSSGGKP